MAYNNGVFPTLPACFLCYVFYRSLINYEAKKVMVILLMYCFLESKILEIMSPWKRRYTLPFCLKGINSLTQGLVWTDEIASITAC